MDSVMKGHCPPPRIFGLEPPLLLRCFCVGCYCVVVAKRNGGVYLVYLGSSELGPVVQLHLYW